MKLPGRPSTAIGTLAIAALPAGCQVRPVLPPLMRIEAREYGYAMPESIAAGLTRVRIVNLGTMTLEPGNYVMHCTVPDSADGRSHYDRGMTHAFRIE